jgi:hypothetical protein
VQTAGAQQDSSLMEFQLDGEDYLLVTRRDGKRAGFDLTTGAWISEIEGAQAKAIETGLGLNIPPLIPIPHGVGMRYSLQVANRTNAFGNLKATANVNIYGPNLAIRLTGIALNSPEPTPVDLEGEAAQAASSA